MQRKFEIETKDQVLVDIITGTTVLDPTSETGQLAQDLEEQKPGTCWYSALMGLNGLVRFNHIDHSYFSAASSELVKIEKHLTDYRDLLAEFNIKRKLENEYLEALSKESIDREKAKCILVENQTLKEPIRQLLIDFTQKAHEHKTLEPFCRERNLTRRIEASRMTLSNLGYDPDAERDAQMKFCFPSKTFKDLSLEEKSVVYYQAIKRRALTSYQLETSSWNPNEGIDKLMTCLKTEGALLVYGFEGLPYHGVTSRENYMMLQPEMSIQTRHRCYHLEDKTYDVRVAARGSHSVNIVGAFKLQQGNYIAMQDYRFGSPFSSQHVSDIFLVPYASFCEHLTNVYGVKKATGCAMFVSQKALQSRESYFTSFTLFKEIKAAKAKQQEAQKKTNVVMNP